MLLKIMCQSVCTYQWSLFSRKQIVYVYLEFFCRKRFYLKKCDEPWKLTYTTSRKKMHPTLIFPVLRSSHWYIYQLVFSTGHTLLVTTYFNDRVPILPTDRHFKIQGWFEVPSEADVLNETCFTIYHYNAFTCTVNKLVINQLINKFVVLILC